MKENLVRYKCKGGRYDKVFFRDNWKTLRDITVDDETIPQFMRRTLRSIYAPQNKWVDRREKGGVFNTGHELDEERSLLNYTDTNYRSLCVLINWINEEILNGNIGKYTQIDFYLSNWKNEISKFFKIVSQYKTVIYNDNSEILTKLISSAKRTNEIGDIAEKETIRRLRNKGITDIKQAEFGQSSDWAEGIDVTFSYSKHKNKTIQTKSFIDVEENDNSYTFFQVGGLKKYDPKVVNYFSLYNPEKGFFMFDNTDEIEYLKNNTLKIPKKLKRDI